MVHKSWNVPTKLAQEFHLDASLAQDIQTTTTRPDAEIVKFFCSVRMTYTICAFLAMIVHTCMRNILSFVILCMVKPSVVANATNNATEESLTVVSNTITNNELCGVLDLSAENPISHIERTGDLDWTRTQALNIQGTFYYGYIATLPFAGHLADKFGGKFLFINSITLQSLCFLMMPIFARLSYAWAVVALIIQGLFAGCGNPALYQLFVVWAHPTERTALLSFAYGGYSAGALLAFPISSFLCAYGWEIPFYLVGSVSLLFGISCQWLIYNTLDEHPRITPAERAYLKPAQVEQTINSKVPWKSLLTSLPVYAFTFTHIFHTYGILVLSLMLPRFLKEAIHVNLKEVGILSSAPFLGCLVSKVLTIFSCTYIEKQPNLNITIFRRITYAVFNLITCACVGSIIYVNCQQKTLIVLMTVAIGVTTDLAFSGIYWPSILYFAPSYAGLLSGLANCLASCCGFLVPIVIALLVLNGTKAEWDVVMFSLIGFYMAAALVFGLFSSSKLQAWDKRHKPAAVSNNYSKTNTI